MHGGRGCACTLPPCWQHHPDQRLRDGPLLRHTATPAARGDEVLTQPTWTEQISKHGRTAQEVLAGTGSRASAASLPAGPGCSSHPCWPQACCYGLMLCMRGQDPDRR